MLVESLPDGARLVLSGDPGVLWSAGPGRVFADLLAARACPQIASRTPDPGSARRAGLRRRHRRAEPGRRAGQGGRDRPGARRGRGGAPRRAAASPTRCRGPSDPSDGADPGDHPGHGGAAGTRALNAALKERLNPGPGRFGGFDPGDRVAYCPRAGPYGAGPRWCRPTRTACAWTATGVPVVVPEGAGRRRPCGTAGRSPRTRRPGMRWPAAVVVLPGRRGAGPDPPLGLHGLRPGRAAPVGGARRGPGLAPAVAEVPRPRTTRLPVLLRAQLPAAE